MYRITAFLIFQKKEKNEKKFSFCFDDKNKRKRKRNARGVLVKRAFSSRVKDSKVRMILFSFFLLWVDIAEILC